jgi:hypothetical protein
MDLTICVMLPPRGDADYSRSSHSKMPVLSPVCVYQMHAIEIVSAPRTGYLHVTGCPVDSARQLAEKLCEPDIREVFAGPERMTQMQAKRAYEADVSLIPGRIAAALLTERQATCTWAEFSAMYAHRADRRKLTDVVW